LEDGERKKEGNERLHISPFLAETGVICAAAGGNNCLSAGKACFENWLGSTGCAGGGRVGEGLRSGSRDEESSWDDGEMHLFFVLLWLADKFEVQQ
jgi:hypothetical protein